ncbi:lytic transglycosylase domain-containing protein [Alkalicoccus daliensis]|uniref:Transglycosylase SLT domain-containing protein n=1 Tax=Alkalicoccus daliensis TaxID=745820 RepID=A0A1H0HUK1_9BACI|nr:lytic transglycosylase domain-containing protein [Alkalicoccus daliensis]SDO22828.1 hypothetical protein SAMN04488053_10948 [Alkalicoccus daliensis]
MKKLIYMSSGVTFVLAIAAIFFVLLYAMSVYTSDNEVEEELPVEEEREIYIAQEEVPQEFIDVYQEAEAEYDVPWELLAALHRVETIFSTMDPLISPAGAEGHLQFMPCTWTGWGHPTCGELGLGDIPEEEKTDPEAIERYGGYGVDASGSGEADPFDIEDAVFSAANYLALAGAADGDLEGAVYDYNRADWYVEDVLAYMRAYEAGYELFDLEERQEG